MTVKDGTDMQVWYSNGSNVGTQATPTTDYQHQIKITKVVGYKANNSPLTSGIQYEHIVTVMNRSSLSTATARCVARIVTASATPFTLGTLTAWLNTNGHVTTSDGIYGASGAFMINNASLPVMGIRAIDGETQIIIPRGANNWYTETAAGIIDNVNVNDVLVQIPHVPTYVTLYNVTPTSGDTIYNITLSDDVTNYDQIIIYSNNNDNTQHKCSNIFDNLSIGDEVNLTYNLNNSTPRLYIKNTLYKVTNSTTLTFQNSVQARFSNGSSGNTISYVTNGMHVRPYKVIGVKY